MIFTPLSHCDPLRFGDGDGNQTKISLSLKNNNPIAVSKLRLPSKRDNLSQDAVDTFTSFTGYLHTVFGSGFARSFRWDLEVSVAWIFTVASRYPLAGSVGLLSLPGIHWLDLYCRLQVSVGWICRPTVASRYSLPGSLPSLPGIHWLDLYCRFQVLVS